MKIPIICYHSCNAGSDYTSDDHMALASDLQTIARLDFNVVPLDWVVEALLGEREPPDRAVALTCDDGIDLDWHDAVHPAFGWRRSFANILREFAATMGERQKTLSMTSFVIASPTARKELEVTCLAGHPWWSDHWWGDAEADGLLRIENHSWDHVHPGATRVAQKDQHKGNFTRVDSFDDCEAQVAAAAEYIALRSGRVPRYFAYPYGQASAYLRDTYLPEHGGRLGLRAAFSIDHSYVTAESNRWYLPRFTHGASDTSTSADFERILEQSLV